MKKSPKLTPWLLAFFFLCAQVAWCNVIAPIAVPTPFNSNSIPQAADWNNDIQGVCSYINSSIVAPLNRLTAKGSLYGCDGGTHLDQPVGTNTQVFAADSTQITGTAWASATGQTVVTTVGDLTAFDSKIARQPVGTDSAVLTADSTQATGMAWAVPGASPYPTGTVIAWSPTGAGTTVIPSGWLVCDGTNGTPNLIGRFVIGTRPNGSTATPSAGGYGAETVDVTHGSSTHSHGWTPPPPSATSTGFQPGGQPPIEIKCATGTTHPSSYTHTHTWTITSSGIGSGTSEPADFALIYIIKS